MELKQKILNLIEASTYNVSAIDNGEYITVGFKGVHLANIVIKEDGTFEKHHYLGEKEVQYISYHTTLIELKFKWDIDELVEYYYDNLEYMTTEM